MHHFILSCYSFDFLFATYDELLLVDLADLFLNLFYYRLDSTMQDVLYKLLPQVEQGMEIFCPEANYFEYTVIYSRTSCFILLQLRFYQGVELKLKSKEITIGP